VLRIMSTLQQELNRSRPPQEEPASGQTSPGRQRVSARRAETSPRRRPPVVPPAPPEQRTREVGRASQSGLRDRSSVGATLAAALTRTPSGRTLGSGASAASASSSRQRSSGGRGGGDKNAAGPRDGQAGSKLRNSLRSQNQSQQSDFLGTEDADEAEAQLERDRQHVEKLEACVQKLEASLAQTSDKNQLLEEHVASAGDARPKAVGQDAGSAGPDETATGAPSSGRSTKTLEDMDMESEPGVELVSDSSLVAPDCSMDSAAYSTPPTERLDGSISPSRSSSKGTMVCVPVDPSIGSAALEGDDNGVGYLEELWDFVIQGQLSHEEQPDFEYKAIACFPKNAMERSWARGVACISTRGLRLDAAVPNQDDFLLAMRAPVPQGHVALYGVFDGHGPTGHSCAAFARSYLPECIFSDPELFARPRHVLKRAFAQTQQALLQQPFNVQVSGTTATLALVVDTNSASGNNRLYVAHIGDSRAILASRREKETGRKELWRLVRC